MAIDGFSFLRGWLGAKYRSFAWRDREEIERHQYRQARKLVRYAVRRSPFFAGFYRGRDLDDVWNLPLTDKKTIMENLTACNTLGFHREELVRFCLEAEKAGVFTRRYRGVNVGMSSGTSGSKGIEIVTRVEEARLRGAFFARFPLPRGEKLNWAFILRVSSPAFSLNRFGHRLTWVSQLGTAEEIRRKLNDLRPNLISAPPSMLGILAREAREGLLAVRPRALISYGEVLYPEVERYLGETFGCAVYQIYKATEGAIAISCRERRLHIQEDLMAVQTYDGEGRPAPDGEPCRRMVVTNLVYRGLPYLRYALNDVITVDPRRCPCGSAFRVISRIQGRSDDLFWGEREDREGLQYIFPDYISRAIIAASEEIEEYQAVQTSPAEVLVRIVPSRQGGEEETARGVASGIAGVFAAYRCRRPAVRVAFEAPLPNPASGKLIRISRRFAVDEEARRP